MKWGRMMKAWKDCIWKNISSLRATCHDSRLKHSHRPLINMFTHCWRTLNTMNHALAALAVPSGERHTRSLRPSEGVRPLPPVFKKPPWNVGRESQLPGEPRFVFSSHSHTSLTCFPTVGNLGKRNSKQEMTSHSGWNHSCDESEEADERPTLMPWASTTWQQHTAW